ncbi:MAG: Na+/H+ antiporter NhaC [Ruminococcaceae bacterium]|nr:Na+/H+ antiporter NhaC [Oscillospiraceae bacterium]
MCEKKQLKTWQILLTLLVSLAVLLYLVAIQKSNPGVSLITAGMVAIGLGLAFGLDWKTFESNMGDTIKSMFMGMLIMMFVGILIGSWMSAGTVPLMMYYGLKILPAPIFLIAACLLCCVMSLMTGTSWGTMGTIGVALLGVAEGLGIPVAYAAGAIVVGALFGDKLSPLSDTTIVAPFVSGADIIDHIKSMLWTTIPCLVVSLILYGILGAQFQGGTVASENYNLILTTLEANFNLNPILLLPPVVVLVLIFMRKPTLPVFAVGILLADILAIVVQGRTLPQVFAAMTNGLGASTEVALVDSMINRGGMLSMMTSVALIIGAAVFSSALKALGVFDLLVNTIQSLAKSRKSLLGLSYVLHLVLASLVGVYLVTFAIVGPVLGPTFDKYNLARRNLSRMLEDTGTAFSPIVPWSNISIFILGTLGVSSFDYVLYAPLTYLGVVFAAFYIITGIGIYNKDGVLLTKEKKETQIEA